MRIDDARKEFFENYNEEAMQSIDNISKEYGLVINERSIHLFNINEAFSRFNHYLEGYCDYLINTKNSGKEFSRETINESAKKFIDEGVFVEYDVLYKDTPAFVKSYLEGMDRTAKTVDHISERMFESSIDNVMIGDAVTFCELFMESMSNHFNESMDKLLSATGYKYKKKRQEEKKCKADKPAFL